MSPQQTSNSDLLSHSADGAAKLILSKRAVIAHILIHLIPDFHGLTPQEVVPLIEPANAKNYQGDLMGSSIVGLNQEFASPHGHPQILDLVFDVQLPNQSDQQIRLIINLEHQGNFWPRSLQLRRGIAHCAQLLSAQLGKRTFNPEKLSKVFSIWLYTNAPKHRIGSGYRYSIKENPILSTLHSPDNPVEKEEDYDLLELITLCLPYSKIEPTRSIPAWIMTLSKSFLIDWSIEEQKQALSTMGVPESQLLEVQMNEYRNHYEELLNERFEKGFEKAKKEAQLEQQTRTCEQVMNLIGLGYEATQIANLLMMPETQVKEIIKTGSYSLQ